MWSNSFTTAVLVSLVSGKVIVAFCGLKTQKFPVFRLLVALFCFFFCKSWYLFLLPCKLNCQCTLCLERILHHHRHLNCHLNSAGFSLPPLKGNLNSHIIIWTNTVIWPYLAWLLGTLLAWPWLYILFSRALSLSRCTSNLPPLLKCIAWPCHGPFSYN